MMLIGVDDCFMLKRQNGNYVCAGDIDMSVCGWSCPFRKSLKEQLAQEEKCVQRISKGNGVVLKRDYRSRITGKVIFKKGVYN